MQLTFCQRHLINGSLAFISLKLTSTDSHQPFNCRSRPVSFTPSRTKWFANCACTLYAVDLPPSLSKFRSPPVKWPSSTRFLLVTHIFDAKVESLGCLFKSYFVGCLPSRNRFGILKVPKQLRNIT